MRVSANGSATNGFPGEAVNADVGAVGSPADSGWSRADYSARGLEHHHLVKSDAHETADERESGEPKESAEVAAGRLLQEADHARSEKAAA